MVEAAIASRNRPLLQENSGIHAGQAGIQIGHEQQRCTVSLAMKPQLRQLDPFIQGQPVGAGASITLGLPDPLSHGGLGQVEVLSPGCSPAYIVRTVES